MTHAAEVWEMCGLMRRKEDLILIAKRKGCGAGGGRGASFCITFSIFKFIVDTDMQEPNGERESQKGV